MLKERPVLNSLPKEQGAMERAGLAVFAEARVRDQPVERAVGGDAGLDRGLQRGFINDVGGRDARVTGELSRGLGEGLGAASDQGQPVAGAVELEGDGAADAGASARHEDMFLFCHVQRLAP